MEGAKGEVQRRSQVGQNTGKVMGFIGDSTFQPLPKQGKLLGGHEHGLGVNIKARCIENVHSVGHHSTQEARVDGGE